MSLPKVLQENLALPVIGAPMFIVSQPQLVLAQCMAGIVGSFPALNARPKEVLDEWLGMITRAIDGARRAEPGRKIGPFAVNQIVHHSNDRLDHDIALCVKHRAPMIITSLRAPGDVVKEVHSYGGIVFHDVINVRHAQKAHDSSMLYVLFATWPAAFWPERVCVFLPFDGVFECCPLSSGCHPERSEGTVPSKVSD